VPGTLDEVSEQVEALGRRAVPIPTDLTDEDQVVAMVDAAASALGGLDIVVNNAAVASPGDLTIDRKRFLLLMSVNARAPMVVTHQAVPHLRAAGGGRILNISSAAASFAIEGLMAYGMSKLALEHLTVSSARLLEHASIAVNCFRIDIGTASEGMVFRNGAIAPDWEPTEVAAEGALWMLGQPLDYTGHLVSMATLREREGIMPSRASAPTKPPPGTPIFPGLESSS
jgi:NAD(P)-dependent dehydrogenase (short-subunit alcohol dehydrogenase family)